MDKSIVVYLHKRILFGRKMKELLLYVISVYNIKNTHKNTGAKRHTKTYISYGSIHIQIQAILYGYY